MLLDFAGLLLMAGFVMMNLSGLSSAATVMIIVLLAATVPFLFYMTRLRWLAASGFQTATSDYLDMLIKQMQNNARIAWLTKHSCWITALFLVVFFVCFTVSASYRTPNIKNGHCQWNSLSGDGWNLLVGAKTQTQIPEEATGIAGIEAGAVILIGIDAD